jgi:hypothetical protein
MSSPTSPLLGLTLSDSAARAGVAGMVITNREITMAKARVRKILPKPENLPLYFIQQSSLFIPLIRGNYFDSRGSTSLGILWFELTLL